MLASPDGVAVPALAQNALPTSSMILQDSLPLAPSFVEAARLQAAVAFRSATDSDAPHPTPSNR